MIIKVGGLEPLGPIGVYAYANHPIFYVFRRLSYPRNGVDTDWLFV